MFPLMFIIFLWTNKTKEMSAMAVNYILINNGHKIVNKYSQNLQLNNNMTITISSNQTIKLFTNLALTFPLKYMHLL